jgi:hypothetical protein
MTKKQNIPNNADSDPSFWIFGFGFYFGLGLFRISCFGFRILIRERLGAINNPNVVQLNMQKLRI